MVPLRIISLLFSWGVDRSDRGKVRNDKAGKWKR